MFLTNVSKSRLLGTKCFSNNKKGNLCPKLKTFLKHQGTVGLQGAGATVSVQQTRCFLYAPSSTLTSSSEVTTEKTFLPMLIVDQIPVLCLFVKV